ncbi:hypothetical protein BH10PSE4_BH10PSE4_45980 [soil metagenome]
MKIPTKVFLTSDTIRVLDDRARRTKRQKSEIVRTAVEAYLSPDSVEAGEAALFRRLDRMSRQLDRLERDVTIANEAIGLFVKTWLKVTPAMSASKTEQPVRRGRSVTRRSSTCCRGGSQRDGCYAGKF